MSKTIDFDAFRAERAEKPIPLKIGGKSYDLPPSMPAAIAVDLIHLKIDISEKADVPVDMLDKVGRAVFGPEIWVTVLEEHRITVDELGPLIEMVLEAYKPETPEGEADPQAASTQETTPPSSPS